MNENIEISDLVVICQSCGSKFSGMFCSKCGEKKFDPQHDLSIIKFIEHSVDIYFHFDTKFFKTFQKLFFYPGTLTKNFISGRRVLYMKPMQLFVLASIVFYFLLPRTDAYYSNVYDLNGKFSIENMMQYNSSNKIFVKKIKYHASEERVVNYLRSHMISSSKLFLFTIFPSWALILFALFYKSNRFYISHLVFSLHCFTAFILIHMLYLFVLAKFMNQIPLLYIVPLFIIFALYMFFAIRKFYQLGIMVSLLKCVVACFAFLIMLELYRESITIINLYFL
jgi:Protein of unknown function (DUF3667)